MSELEALRTVATEGVLKAPALDDGGVVVQAGREFLQLVVGQDMTIGFEGLADGRLDFTVSESLALRVMVRKAVCWLASA